MRFAFASLVSLACFALMAGGACTGDQFVAFPNTGGTGGAGGTGAGSHTGGHVDTGGGGSTGGKGGGGGPAAECATAADCDTKLGAAPCDAWACNMGQCEASSPGCADADQDGYGTGAACACAGLDCDDADDTIHDSVPSASCYSGPPNTAGVGTCQAGVQSCSAGVWTPCVGEVGPSGEACNGQDDDCNGQVDDGLPTFTCGLGACKKTVPSCISGVVQVCNPTVPASNTDGPQCNNIDDDCDGVVDEDCKNCVKVALPPLGNDGSADPVNGTPMATIQAAINYAASNANAPKLVCVAAGITCGATGTYANTAGTTVTMANGVSVAGNYESTLWNRCGNSTTVIQPQTPEGVTFPATVNTATTLDGFKVDRFNNSTTAGITVNGATNVIISAVSVINTPNVMTSYGVNIINGGDALITSKCHIDAGFGSVESIAVRAVGSKVALSNNCLSLDANGRCDDFCGPNPAIRGRTAVGPGVTYAVHLNNAPGSTIETSALCANQADQGALVRIEGDATGVLVRANLMNAFGGAQDSHGIWMKDCNDAAPWIVDNHYIASAGTSQQSRVDGVRAEGACHPVIDSNVHIAGGGEGQAANPNGVHCAANAQGVPSQCVVLGNKLIRGSDFGFPPIAAGVRCDGGSCMRVAGNVISGRGGGTSYGVYLEKTGTLVDANVISGGCSAVATGLYADDAFARVQNNRIFGFTQGDCAAGGQPPQITHSRGMHLFIAAGLNEIDVHSNDVDGGGLAMACTSHGIQLALGALAPSSGVGIFRNNIVRGGVCSAARYVFEEAAMGANPRIFEHNDLDPYMQPTALYLDGGTTAVNTAAAVDMLGGMIVSGTLSVDAQYVNFPVDLHLSAGSMCIGAGTANGAPTKDMEGDARDPATPDIGADEH